MEEIENFDLEDFLNYYDIEFWEKGKNVGENWIGISCPYCDDTHNHCGIHRKNKTFYCWRCGEKGNVFKLIKILTGENPNHVLEEFKNPFSTVSDDKNLKKEITEVIPKSAKKELSVNAKKYIRKRRFNPEEVIKKYDLYESDPLTDYKYRIIIPVYQENKIVTFTSVDYTGERTPKYLHNAEKRSIESIKDCVYGLDKVKDYMIIVEGIFDCWRIGDNCVCLFGMKYSEKQIVKILNHPCERIFIMFDGEKLARINAKKLGNRLSLLGKRVNVIELSDNIDPDDLTRDEISNIKNTIHLL